MLLISNNFKFIKLIIQDNVRIQTMKNISKINANYEICLKI